MGNICRPQRPVEEIEIKTAVKVEENMQVIPMPDVPDANNKINEDQQQVEEVRSVENQKQDEPKRKENKKLAKIAAVIDQEIILENITKKEKQKDIFVLLQCIRWTIWVQDEISC